MQTAVSSHKACAKCMQNEQLHEEQELDGARRLPINQRIEDSLDTDGLVMASTEAAIPESNVGFQMLQKMGWKGQGLGSKEDGEKQLDDKCPSFSK